MLDMFYECGQKMFVPLCDRCGDMLPPEFDFDDAIEAIRAAGWRTRKDPLTGDWMHYCPECAREMRPSAASDFAGIV